MEDAIRDALTGFGLSLGLQWSKSGSQKRNLTWSLQLWGDMSSSHVQVQVIAEVEHLVAEAALQRRSLHALVPHMGHQALFVLVVLQTDGTDITIYKWKRLNCGKQAKRLEEH